MNADKLDLILEFISNGDNSNDIFNAFDLHRRLFPDLNEDLVKILILEIYNKNALVCVIEEPYPFENTIIYSNGATKSFLASGGFTKIENDLKKLEQKSIFKEDLELKKLRADLQDTQNKLKDYQTTKVISWIGGFIGIFLAILKIIEWIGLLN